ncbi:hypothetical protein B1B_18338, partial [mine drainage metagenome]
SRPALSPYHPRFTQGATVVPRVLHMVEDAPDPSRLGLPRGVRRIRSRRSSLEKSPWRDLPDRGPATIEAQFVFGLHLGIRSCRTGYCLPSWSSSRFWKASCCQGPIRRSMPPRGWPVGGERAKTSGGSTARPPRPRTCPPGSTTRTSSGVNSRSRPFASAT